MQNRDEGKELKASPPLLPPAAPIVPAIHKTIELEHCLHAAHILMMSRVSLHLQTHTHTPTRTIAASTHTMLHAFLLSRKTISSCTCVATPDDMNTEIHTEARNIAASAHTKMSHSG
jgi:hypothetical protein